MSMKNQYDSIIKYIVTAQCVEPLHIGNAVGDKEEVLIHPVDEVPFIQATSIAGVFRAYCSRNHTEKEVDELFGFRKFEENENAYEKRSRIQIGDGVFLEDEKVKLELRPRIAIDSKNGTCGEGAIKGTYKTAGHKFQMEYIGAGAVFRFPVYVYDEKYQSMVEEIFTALNQDVIQFGGQKSNGCGSIRVKQLKYKIFHMTEEKDRCLWAEEETLPDGEYTERLSEIKYESCKGNAFEITVFGKTEGELLVKSIAVEEDAKEKSPDATNIKNAKGDYIVPGSSFKGTIRNQMKKIADYLNRQGGNTAGIIEETFGKKGEDKQNAGKIGNIRFFDAVVGDKTANKSREVSNRIHIDKFTGGVINGSLFQEKNVFGEVKFRIVIADKNHPERTCGLLLLALRDLALGMVNVGSGYSVGKGIIDVDTIKITDFTSCDTTESRCAEIQFKSGKIKDDAGIITSCMQSIWQGKE